MDKRVYLAAQAVKSKFPKVFPFISKYWPGAIKLGTQDLLAETLEQAAAGKNKNGKPITDFWGYCERAYEQKKMDRTALDGEAQAAQFKMELVGDNNFFRQVAEFSKAKAEGKI